MAGAIPAPTITGVTGEGTDNVNLGGCDVSATGENLETATRMEFAETEDGEAFYAMDVEYADGTLSGFADFIGTAPDSRVRRRHAERLRRLHRHRARQRLRPRDHRGRNRNPRRHLQQPLMLATVRRRPGGV